MHTAGRLEEHEEKAPAPIPATGDHAGELAAPRSPSDVMRLQGAIGNHATGAVLSSRMLLRLGDRLDKPRGRGTPKPAHGETPGKQRRYSVAQYIRMWEREQGRKITPEDRETIERGCIGLTADNLSGGGNPPLDLVFSTFEQAHKTMVAKNRTMDEHHGIPYVKGARWMMFAKLFWSNQNPDPKKRKKGDPKAFRPDRRGRVNMKGYEYLEQPGFVNFDYGWWDDASQSFWHANHLEYGNPKDPMIVLQSTREKFAKKMEVAGTRRYGYADFDRVVYGVALAKHYDPRRAAGSSKP